MPAADITNIAKYKRIAGLSLSGIILVSVREKSMGKNIDIS
jgi:hypothetical protein